MQKSLFFHTFIAENKAVNMDKKEIEQLRQQLGESVKMNTELNVVISELRNTVDTLQKENDSLQQTILHLQQVMETYRKALYGKKSEKHLPIDPSVLEPTLFDMSLPEEEQAALEAEVKKMEEQNAKTIEVKSHKREVRKPVYKDLPIEETHLYPKDVNPDEYVEIGVEHTDTLAIQPARMYIKRIVRHKFVLKSSLQIEFPEKTTFLMAPLPDVLLPKCMASESLLADILIDKYVYHLPFYRVIQKYKEFGVTISDSTLGTWFSSVCRKLEPLYNKHREQILSTDYIQVDESTLPVIDNEKHRAVKGYVWTIRNALTGDVCFHYDYGSRSGETARRLIGNYQGTLQTDGYEVYHIFENSPGKRLLGCWAHVRRKFVEALNEDKRHASEALVYIGKLYALEKEMKVASLSAEEVCIRRRKESYPIIQSFERWLLSVSTHVPPKSCIGKAISYAYVLLPRLSRFVNDGRYHIDNNGIENAIRPLAVGRKNYLFCGNHDAAVRAAIVYSFFGSCKARGIDPRVWLEDVMKRLPMESDMTVLLPAHWSLMP